MSFPRRLGAVIAALAVTLLGTLVAPGVAHAQADPGPPPNSIASMGDSITRAFNACGWFIECTSRSYSTGSNSSVDSHYLRIQRVNPNITGNTLNAARSGARINELPGQAATVVNFGAEYVTILVGANDACASSEASMTSVEDFRADPDEALAILKNGLPNARIMIVSIPNIKQLWQIGHTNWLARTFWSLGNICQSMLANPTSTSPEDMARRDRVLQRVVDYNTQLAEACAAYGPNCRFDNNAVFNYSFSLNQVSGWDYFHPSTEGQALLARLTYEQGYNW